MKRAVRFGLLAVLGLAASCEQRGAEAAATADSVLLQERATRLQQAIAHPDSTTSGKPIALWLLPDHLKEISGLAITHDGRVLAHGDERGKVFEVDVRRGIVVKEFTLGNPAVHGDFESIAVVGDSVALLTSTGVLYTFREGAADETVQFATKDTGLGASCEFEGMAFDAKDNALLLACKHTHDKTLKDSLVIFRWPLGKGKNGTVEKVSHLAVPMATVIGANGWDGFHPSDITIDPVSGNYVMVASREKALLELTPKGVVVFSRPLPSGHDQAEGVAITSDHILVISDEAKGGPARITLYRWP